MGSEIESQNCFLPLRFYDNVQTSGLESAGSVFTEDSGEQHDSCSQGKMWR